MVCVVRILRRVLLLVGCLRWSWMESERLSCGRCWYHRNDGGERAGILRARRGEESAVTDRDGAQSRLQD